MDYVFLVVTAAAVIALTVWIGRKARLAGDRLGNGVRDRRPARSSGGAGWYAGGFGGDGGGGGGDFGFGGDCGGGGGGGDC